MSNDRKGGAFNASLIPDEQFILERPGINALLEKALGNLVVFVTAGEGYGKTHAVKSFLRGRDETIIWVSITERDNDPWHLWEHIAKSVGIHEPKTGKFLEEMGFPESHGQMTHYLSALYGTHTNKEKRIVVVDDCHLINNETVLKFVNRLLAFPLRKEPTILISRTEIKLDTISWLSKGLLSRISADDLRFTEEEIIEYFRLRDISLSRDESTKIFTDTEGWILAISLIAEEMQREGKKYCPSILERGSFRAMEEVLFASIPASLQRLLVVLSLFEQWPLEAAEKIAAAMPEKLPGTKEINEALKNLSSLICYDSYLHGFRIHRIFLDFLREKQHELSREEVKTACVIKAQWCMENRLYREAAINYTAAADYQGLMRAIYSYPRLISPSSAYPLLEIIDRLLTDDERNEDDKNFLFLRHVTRAGILLNMGHFDECRAALEASVEYYEALPQNGNSATCTTRSWILSACYNTLGALSLYTRRINRDFCRSVEYFRQGNNYYKQYPHSVQGPMSKVSIGSYVNIIGHPPAPGEFEENIDILAQCILYASDSIGGYLWGADRLCRAEFSFFMGDMNTAEQQAREAVFKAREKGQYEVESRGLFFLLRIHLCNGDAALCRETLEQMEAQLGLRDYINRYVIYDIMAGWFYAHIGETDRTASWLRNKYEESDLNFAYSNFETMVKVKILFAEKHYGQALKFLERKDVREGPGSFHLGMLEICVLKAAIQIRMGDEQAALNTLETVYEMAACNFQNGCNASEQALFNMPFIELGEDMRVLADAALNNETSFFQKTAARHWLQAIWNKASVYRKKLGTVKEGFQSDYGGGEQTLLTSQEIAILTGISRGFTREKVAEDNSLSVNTVKNIIKTIYQKLNASNRADAIRIAGKAGIL